MLAFENWDIVICGIFVDVKVMLVKSLENCDIVIYGIFVDVKGDVSCKL